MRGLDGSTIAALDNPVLNWAQLVKLDFASPIYLTTYGHDVTASGQVWSASGHILKIADVRESADIKVGSTSLELSGVEQTFISLFLNNNYIDVGYSNFTALLDSEGQVIGTPIEVFSGVISGATIEDSGTTSKVKVEIASHWADFEKKSGRKSNSGSQKIYFPSDLAFDFNFPRDIKWGKK